MRDNMKYVIVALFMTFVLLFSMKVNLDEYKKLKHADEIASELKEWENEKERLRRELLSLREDSLNTYDESD